MNTPTLRTAVAAATVLTLAACGGGGGSDDSGGATPSSDVNATNYTSLATPLVRALLGASGTASSVTALSSSTGPRAAAAAATEARATTQLTTDWLLRARLAVRAAAGDRAKPLASYTDTVACGYGGYSVVTLNDKDNNQDISRGDSVDIQFNGCVESFGLPAIDGGLSLRVNSFSLDGNDELTALDASATFTAFRAGGLASLTGNARLQLDAISGGDRVRFTYDGLRSTALTGDGATTVYDFLVDSSYVAGSSSFTVTGTIGIAGQSFTLDSPQTFVQTGGAAPSAGTLRLRDAAGDALHLLARSSEQFDLQFVPAGATAAANATTGLAWGDYD